MRDQLPALLLAVDAATRAEVRALLSGSDVATVTCTEGAFEDGMRLVRDAAPDVVMVVMDGDARGALSLMEEIVRAAPGAQLLALSRDASTENIIKAMRAGASEFLSLPLDPQQVLKALIKIITLRRLAAPRGAGGQIWTVYGPKGGAGVTTAAANLGIELIAMGKSACVVDLDFQAGDLALVLNLNPHYTMLDIALNFRRLDSVFLQGTLARHPSGLFLLAAPPHGSPDTGDIPVEQVSAVLELLKSLYDVVIVDTARALAEETLAALQGADRILLLIELTLPFLRGYRRTMELLDSMSVARDRVDVIVSKHNGARAAIPLDEAKKTLEVSVAHTLPRDDDTALTALNKGLPLREVKASSPLRRGIVQLAEALIAPPAAGAGEERKRKKGLLGGLFAS
jgi:pilus assembly protein CpaE